MQDRDSLLLLETRIDELRDAYAVTSEDQSAFLSVKKAFSKLSPGQKAKISASRVEKLGRIEAKLTPGNPRRTVYVTDEPFCAKGDGETNDRAAIQAAIDSLWHEGGGRLCFPAGRTFVSSNLLLRSHVHLFFEDGATLRQSENPDEFVDPLRDFEPRRLKLGQYTGTDIEWDAVSYYNFPFLYAAEGTTDFSLTGHGIIRLSAGEGGDRMMTMITLGLFSVEDFLVADLKFEGFQAYCCSAKNSQNGMFRAVNVDASLSIRGGTDGINLTNSRNIRVTGCKIKSGDDGIYVSSDWNDPRKSVWAPTIRLKKPENIEIDHNDCEVTWDATKAFCFIMWGASYPNQKDVEVENIYVHDNYFQTMGAWVGNWNAETQRFDFNGSTNPMKNIRIVDNVVDTIQDNFHALPVSDFYSYPSMKELRNADFEAGSDIWWVSRLKNSRACTGICTQPVGQNGKACGYIADLDRGDAALYEGLYLESGRSFTLSAYVQTSGDPVRLFVKDQLTQELIASKQVQNTAWETVSLPFAVPESGNYQLGIERGEAKAGWARIDDVRLETKPNA